MLMASRLQSAVIAILLVASVAVPQTVRAEPSKWSTLETSSGAEVFSGIWSLYSNVTMSPFSFLRDDFPRVRIGTGYGRYGFDALVGISGLWWASRAHVETLYAEALGGWRWTLGRTTVSAFGGVMFDGTTTRADEPAVSQVKTANTIKGVIETWTWLSSDTYLQADGQWRSVYDGGWARARLGTAIWGGVSAGVEAIGAGGVDLQQRRAGGFVRAAFDWGEVSVSGGVGGTPTPVRDPYATVSILTRF